MTSNAFSGGQIVYAWYYTAAHKININDIRSLFYNALIKKFMSVKMMKFSEFLLDGDQWFE